MCLYSYIQCIRICIISRVVRISEHIYLYLYLYSCVRPTKKPRTFSGVESRRGYSHVYQVKENENKFKMYIENKNISFNNNNNNYNQKNDWVEIKPEFKKQLLLKCIIFFLKYLRRSFNPHWHPLRDLQQNSRSIVLNHPHCSRHPRDTFRTWTFRRNLHLRSDPLLSPFNFSSEVVFLTARESF